MSFSYKPRTAPPEDTNYSLTKLSLITGISVKELMAHGWEEDQVYPLEEGEIPEGLKNSFNYSPDRVVK